MIRRSKSPAETEAIGALLARELAPHGTLLLRGGLGAGKTVLVRGLARGLGIDPDEIQSPTFVLVRQHSGNGVRLVHVDLYRLTPDEVAAEGIEELLHGPGVKAVEWAERLPFEVPGAVVVEIEAVGEEREVRRLDGPARVAAGGAAARS